jgi:hypothetical protein
MMRWQIEAAAKQALSAMPGGVRVYRFLQERFGRLNTVDPREYWTERGQVFDPVQRGGALVGLRLLEVGTGWHPVVALVAAARGAESVTTIDLNLWISHATLRVAAKLALRALADADDVRDDRLLALNRIADHAFDDKPVQLALAQLGIDYRAPSDASRTGLLDRSIDLVVHTDVFEHIPPTVIDRLLTEMWRVQRPGGLHIARICPGDHFAERDGRITTANHLQFSERAWRFIGGSGIAYHNRLRPTDFLKSFERAGYTVISMIPRIDRTVLEEIRAGRVRLDSQFTNYSNEELATTSFHLIARR